MRKRTAKQANFVGVLGLLVSTMAVASVWGADLTEGQQVLTNPDFALPLSDDNPPGWFRAMMPQLTTGLEAGVGRDKAGPYLFLRQAAVQGQLLNNWAQRMEAPPIGAKVRLETEVAVRDAQGKGAVVLVMFFDKAGKVTGTASSEGRYDLTGTKEFTPVRLETTVPPGSDLAIVRLGLSPAAGEIRVRYARLYFAGGRQGPSAAAVSPPGTQEERQILTNPDFALPLVGGNPPGWFGAMIPHLTTGLEIGVSRDEAGPYLFLRQAGVQGQLFNNWAQRIQRPPVGAKVRLETQVAVRNAQGKGAVVLLMFFDKVGKVVGTVSSEGRYDLTGTKGFTPVQLETTVPPDSDSAIVRLGLSPAAGEIQVRYARLYVAGGMQGPSAAAASPPGAQEERQVLTNPDFALPLSDDNPPGWFRAMMPKLTTGLEAGVGRDEAGPYLFLKQAAVQGQLLNNWAQRIEGPPIGAKVRLETQVAVRNALGKGAVVLVMFFDKGGNVVGAVSSEGQYDLTGTKGFTPVRLETTVPPESSLAIVRLGLSSAAGEIRVRSARLYFTGGQQGPSAPATSPPAAQEGQPGPELLINGDVEGAVTLDTLVGWFGAMRTSA